MIFVSIFQNGSCIHREDVLIFPLELGLHVRKEPSYAFDAAKMERDEFIDETSVAWLPTRLHNACPGARFVLAGLVRQGRITRSGFPAAQYPRQLDQELNRPKRPSTQHSSTKCRTSGARNRIAASARSTGTSSSLGPIPGKNSAHPKKEQGNAH